MTTIDATESICTLINVFTVQPSKHEELFELLQKATEEVMCKMPGYISTNLHLSDDMKTVTNYAQWRSLDDYNNMLRDPMVQQHMKEALAIAEKLDPHMYHIIWQHCKE